MSHTMTEFFTRSTKLPSVAKIEDSQEVVKLCDRHNLPMDTTVRVNIAVSNIQITVFPKLENILK